MGGENWFGVVDQQTKIGGGEKLTGWRAVGDAGEFDKEGKPWHRERENQKDPPRALREEVYPWKKNVFPSTKRKNNMSQAGGCSNGQ